MADHILQLLAHAAEAFGELPDLVAAFDRQFLGEIAAGQLVAVSRELGERTGDFAAHKDSCRQTDNKRCKCNGYTGPDDAADFILYKSNIITYTDNERTAGNADIRGFMYSVTVTVCIA
ncbi:hypothetical protein D3C73_798350 [compost metagenome]